MTQQRRLGSIAIVGGGTAGWLAASILARALPGTGCSITVIESAEVGTIGVGEATIPPIIDLLRFLSINEADFIRHTGATYKLGIKFSDWSRPEHSYWHPFGTFGAAINRRPFFHAWQKARHDGMPLVFEDFSLAARLGEGGKFRFPDPAGSGPVAGLRYALHFDATLVAKYLRTYAERLGVRRLERHVAGATRRADGALEELICSDDSRLSADFFIDCSGFRGVLIEQVLKTGYIDWSRFLPCDRAVAVPSELEGPRPPFTQAFARAAGWRWRIPLQHRVGNGYVYSSRHLEDAEAWADLESAIGGKPLAEPRLLRFVTGRRRLFWNRNCVALGLASGFLEPLESTSIHLVMSGMYKLLEHFPDRDFAQSNIDSYNAELGHEMERIRDFIVLHYCLTGRDDTPFWRDCGRIELPDSLGERIERYRRTGRVRPLPGELFNDASWFYIFEGLGTRQQSHDPLMDVVEPGRLREILTAIAEDTRRGADASPSHDGYFAALPGRASGSRAVPA